MSANNYILVKENKKNFKVMMIDADTGVQLRKAEKFNGWREALNRAQAIVDWKGVEYGIQVDLKTKCQKHCK